MTLDAVEFIRRFLLHVLPAGFVKIRHFGLLANRNRRQALALCRLHLNATAPDNTAMLNRTTASALNRSCPQCKCGTLHVVAPFSQVELKAPTTNRCELPDQLVLKRIMLIAKQIPPLARTDAETVAAPACLHSALDAPERRSRPPTHTATTLSMRPQSRNSPSTGAPNGPLSLHSRLINPHTSTALAA